MSAGVGVGVGAAVGLLETSGLTTKIDGVFDVLPPPEDKTAPTLINAVIDTPTFNAADELTRGIILLITALAMILELPWSTAAVRSRLLLPSDIIRKLIALNEKSDAHHTDYGRLAKSRSDEDMTRRFFGRTGLPVGLLLFNLTTMIQLMNHLVIKETFIPFPWL